MRGSQQQAGYCRKSGREIRPLCQVNIAGSLEVSMTRIEKRYKRSS
jgi:hypothetical protein